MRIDHNNDTEVSIIINRFLKNEALIVHSLGLLVSATLGMTLDPKTHNFLSCMYSICSNYFPETMHGMPEMPNVVSNYSADIALHQCTN